jgi:hypothetical protein
MPKAANDSTRLTDPVIALCREAQELSVEVSRAFAAVLSEAGDKNGVAQAAAEEVQERYNALFERITAIKPATLQGWIAQIAIVRRELLDIKGLPADELDDLDMFEKAAFTVMGHAELFAERDARKDSDDPAVATWIDFMKIRDAINSSSEDPSDELEAQYGAASDKVVETPARSLDGVVAKLRLLRLQCDCGLWIHQGEMIDSIIEDVSRLS